MTTLSVGAFDGDRLARRNAIVLAGAQAVAIALALLGLQSRTMALRT